jgi:hypothetical protein
MPPNAQHHPPGGPTEKTAARRKSSSKRATSEARNGEPGRVQRVVRPVRPKPLLVEQRGMGGKGRKVAWWATDAKLLRSLTTVYPRRCDDIPQSTTRWGKHQLRLPQVPGRERHPTASDWSSTLRLRSGPEARMERRSARARRDDSAEHAAMVNASEGAMRRRQAEPAYSG